MYHLFVKGLEQPYPEADFSFQIDRSIRAYEYTDEAIALKFGTFNPDAIQEMLKHPAILTHEHGRDIEPILAKLTGIERRPNAGVINVYWERVETAQPFTFGHIVENREKLDIGPWELNRTHWALKDVDLLSLLKSCEIIVDPIKRPRPLVNIANHRFNIAFSFPGSVRADVEKIIPFIEKQYGPNSYFYDKNYQGELARPNHDLLLQEIYRDRCELVVVFLNEDYAGRVWCNTEWDAVRDSILGREQEHRVMFIRTDDGAVPGVNKQDGYIDLRETTHEQIAQSIINRYESDRLPDPIQALRDLESQQLDRLKQVQLDGVIIDAGEY